MLQPHDLDGSLDGIAAPPHDLVDRKLGRAREPDGKLVDGAPCQCAGNHAHNGLPVSGSGRRCARA